MLIFTIYWTAIALPPVCSRDGE